MNKLDPNYQDQTNIKTLCEFLFSDQFIENATFNRFELCFQPLFNNIDISLDKVFKYICGSKKKYITYKRFAKAYLEFTNGICQSKDAEKFFQILIYNILKGDGFIGVLRENENIGNSEDEIRNNINNYLFLFSNKRSCEKRDCISKLQIIADNEENIHGINLEYDEVFESQMYPENYEDDLFVRLEINLNIIDEELIEENINEFSSIKQGNYRDAITHIYGTINEETNYITFLGFKCISGKTLFFGKPKGKGFLFGKFGYKFHYLTLQLKNDGITYIEPGFKENIRKNYYLDKIFGKFSEQDLEENEIIKEEDYFDKISDENEIDQLITTQILPENSLNKNNLEEEIPGNDYKEVVDQSPRQWILNTIIVKNDDKQSNESLSLNGALKIYDELTKINLNYNVKQSYYSIINDYNPMISSYNLNSIENMDLPFVPNPFAYEEQKEEHLDDRIEIPVKKEIFLPRKAKIFKPEIKESILANGTKINITQEKWDGDINKPTNPNIFLNKVNYQQLMDKIKQNIFENSEKYGTEEDKKMINEIFNPAGQKTVIISKSKKCYLNIQKTQTEIKMKNKKDELLNKESIPKKISAKQIYQIEPNKYKCAQEKWHSFRKKIEQLNGIFILQTIGSIIRAKLLLAQKIVVPSLEDQFKLVKKLQENQTIIDFLNSGNDEEKNDLHTIRTTILMPTEHPEKIPSLQVLQKHLDDLKNLLKDKNLKEKDRLKLEKLSDLYLKQKNILIENEAENIKKGGGNGSIKEIIKNSNKYQEKETIKINKAKEEEKKKTKEVILEQRKEEQEKRQNILKNKKKVSPISSSEKIFNNQKILQNCQNWEDDEFMANRKSLCPYDNKGNWIIPKNGRDAFLRGWNQIEWARINEIKKFNTFDVFYEGATLDDIKQGGIGDCYFLSAIGSLTNFPNFIESHFYLEDEKKHIYGIYFFINGRWKRVLVDDQFPCRMNDKNIFGELYFSCSFQNEIWVSLIEKAWAKVNGSYANIDYGGYSYEVFDIMTEAYSDHIEIDVKSKEKIWEILLNSEKRKYLMTVASKSFVFFTYWGLEEGHAYTVVKIKVIEPKKGEKIRLIQLRNPYGEKEYTGDWGKCSKKWTPELKKKYNYKEEIEKYDGMFYMSFDDFYSCFKLLNICKIEKDYQTSYCKIKKNQAKRCQILALTVDDNYPRTFIQLYKKNLRIVKNNSLHHNYNADNNVMGFIILAKLVDIKNGNGEKEIKYVDSIAGYETHLAIEVDLTQGTYFIFCDVNYRYNNQDYGYAITCYHKTSEKNLVLENITNAKDVDPKKFLELTLIHYCLYSHSKKKVFFYKGIKIYEKEGYNDKDGVKTFPFDISCLVNTTNKTVKIRTKIKYGKSFCIYNDSNCNEKSTSVDKEIEPYRAKCVLVMRYNKESKFHIYYENLST